MIYIINEPPQACQRARHGQGRTYDPQKTLKERWRWILKAQHKGPLLSGKPLELDITFYMPIPKSLSKKKQDALLGQAHSKKPDWDNTGKLLSDVCTGVIVEDDNLFSDVRVRKRYSYSPRIEFTIKEVQVSAPVETICKSGSKCFACVELKRLEDQEKESKIFSDHERFLYFEKEVDANT